jgi:hypothetical protein
VPQADKVVDVQIEVIKVLFEEENKIKSKVTFQLIPAQVLNPSSIIFRSLRQMFTGMNPH